MSRPAGAKPARSKVAQPIGSEPCDGGGDADGEGNRVEADGSQGVGGLRSSGEGGERRGGRTRRSEGGPCGYELQEGNMDGASTPGNMSPELLKVAERAKREPEAQFHSLAHLIDEAALRRAFDRIRGDAAVGVDGVTKEQYGQDFDEKLR